MGSNQNEVTNDNPSSEEHITLFPTRLREFEEKGDLVFHHYLSAKDDFIKQNAHLHSMDPIRRRSFSEDMIDNDKHAYEIIQNIFTKAAVVVSNSQKTNFHHVLETRLIPLIFEHMGQAFSPEELHKWIKANDHKDLGVIDIDGFHRICVHFLKDPAAFERVKKQDFSFSHLISEIRSDDSNRT